MITADNITDEQIRELRDGVYPFVLAHPLSVHCPVCDATPNETCASMAKRWQAVRTRTFGAGDNGWRKTPHRERVIASRVENGLRAETLKVADLGLRDDVSTTRRRAARARCAEILNARGVK